MTMRENVFDALVQWCLVFDQPLSRITIQDSTCCSLHGMIAWQNLNLFLGEKTPAQSGRLERELALFDKSASVVNDGIFCTIGELQQGQVKARLTLEFSQEKSGRKVVRDISWRDVAKAPLKQWLITLQNQIREQQREDGKTISLAGLIKSSGYLSERSLKYKAALAAIRGVPLSEVPLAHVHRAVVHEIVNNREYIGHGSSATVALYNGLGEIIGSRTLTV